MPVLIRPTNNFLDQVRNASEGKYNTVNKTIAGGVTFKKCRNSGIPYFYLKITTSHEHAPFVPTIVYTKLGRVS